jgi:hypothetical protein
VEGRVEVSLLAANKKELLLRESSLRVNDGKYHVVRLVRTPAELSLQVDDLQVCFLFMISASWRLGRCSALSGYKGIVSLNMVP